MFYFILDSRQHQIEDIKQKVPLKRNKKDAADHSWVKPFFENNGYKSESLNNGSKFIVLLKVFVTLFVGEGKKACAVVMHFSKRNFKP